MAVYFLFAHDRCDRCSRITSVRSMSFFTSDTLCIVCLSDEAKLLADMRARGVDPLEFEECGYLPREDEPEPREGSASEILGTLRARTPSGGRITRKDLVRALRRLRVRKASHRTAPIEPDTGRGLPPPI